MKAQWKTEAVSEFFNTLLSLDNARDLQDFMRDVATIRELTEMSSRWKAAQMLNEGNSYRRISESTGLSTTTVTRVAYWVENGEGGYKTALNKLKKHHAP
jgi:TrpR-related protein YerC/YecD